MGHLPHPLFLRGMFQENVQDVQENSLRVFELILLLKVNSCCYQKRKRMCLAKPWTFLKNNVWNLNFSAEGENMIGQLDSFNFVILLQARGVKIILIPTVQFWQKELFYYYDCVISYIIFKRLDSCILITYFVLLIS